MYFLNESDRIRFNYFNRSLIKQFEVQGVLRDCCLTETKDTWPSQHTICEERISVRWMIADQSSIVYIHWNHAHISRERRHHQNVQANIVEVLYLGFSIENLTKCIWKSKWTGLVIDVITMKAIDHITKNW